MLSKKFKSRTLPFLLVALLVLYCLARYAFGWLQFYRIPTDGMEPALPVGKMIWATNVRDAKRGEVVCYKRVIGGMPDVQEPESQVFVGRMVAVGGDELTLKNGRAWVNGQATEEDLLLRFLYSVSREDHQANRAFFSKLPANRRAQQPFPEGATDSLRYGLNDPEATALQGKAVRYQQPVPPGSDAYYPAMRQLFGPNPAWTMDNFGPILIPQGKIFILGDNRHNSLDSRYKGLVSVTDVVGTVFFP